MGTPIRVAAVQFERRGTFRSNVAGAVELVREGGPADFVLLGGEFSLNERAADDPYPILADVARALDASVIAAVNANRHRIDTIVDRKGFSSIHAFSRAGHIVAVQDKHALYWRERGWFRPGRAAIRTFEVDGLEIGLVRGLDLLSPEHTRALWGADVLFAATMAVDDLMLRAASLRAAENGCAVVLASFIGDFAGLSFPGNAAVIAPSALITRSMRQVLEPVVLDHTPYEGVARAALDIDHIRAVRAISIPPATAPPGASLLAVPA